MNSDNTGQQDFGVIFIFLIIIVIIVGLIMYFRDRQSKSGNAEPRSTTGAHELREVEPENIVDVGNETELEQADNN